MTDKASQASISSDSSTISTPSPPLTDSEGEPEVVMAPPAEVDMDAVQRTRAISVADFPGEPDSPQLAVDARAWVNEVDAAKVLTNMNSARQAQFASMALTKTAKRWYTTLLDDGVEDLDDWTVLKKLFLGRFTPTSTMGDRVAIRAALVQRPGESVLTFYDRCNGSQHMMDQGQDPPTVLTELGCTRWAHAVNVKLNFVAGLHPSIRRFITQQAELKTAAELKGAAQRQEAALRDVTAAKFVVPEVGEVEYAAPGPVVEWVTTKPKQGKQRTSHKTRPTSTKTPATQTPVGSVCFYCGKGNHWQIDCRTRLQDKASLISFAAYKAKVEKAGGTVVAVEAAAPTPPAVDGIFTYEDTLYPN